MGKSSDHVSPEKVRETKGSSRWLNLEPEVEMNPMYWVFHPEHLNVQNKKEVQSTRQQTLMKTGSPLTISLMDVPRKRSGKPGGIHGSLAFPWNRLVSCLAEKQRVKDEEGKTAEGHKIPTFLR